MHDRPPTVSPTDALRDAPDGAPRQGRIDTTRADAVRAWAERFRVTPDEVLEAVRTVGDEARDVEAFLRGGGERVP